MLQSCIPFHICKCICICQDVNRVVRYTQPTMRLCLLLLSPVVFLGFTMPVFAQEQQETISYEVTATVERVGTGESGQEIYYTVDEEGRAYTVDPLMNTPEGLQYDIHKGDRIILQVVPNADGTTTAYYSDIIRTKGLWLVFAIFAVVILAVGLRRGLYALLGFGVTLAILFLYVFPRILDGAEPVLTVVLASVVILAVNLFIAHGPTRNTGIAFVSTTCGVVLAYLFSVLFVSLARLSGLGDEQAVFLYWDIGGLHAPVGLLLAGIILGAVGVLDDVAITQCETVAELKSVSPGLGRKELFMRAMRIGRHHVASTVNTLVLAYAGASLPLFLIFLSSDDISWSRFVNTEVVAQEIVRTLAGTTALVLVVPLATAIAAAVWARSSGAEAKRAVHDEHEA